MQAIEARGTRTVTDGEGVQGAIVALEDGKIYVQADRKVLTGTDREAWKGQIDAFFDQVLLQNGSLTVESVEGDELTITKDETVWKGKDEHLQTSGKKRSLTSGEYYIKLKALSHIDELSEASVVQRNPDGAPKIEPDTKSHPFARDGFEYRTVYFQDFDGKYYRITLSAGLNDGVATVYNVGKIKEATAPDGEIISAIGSKARGAAATDTTIAQNDSGVNTQSMQEGAEVFTGDGGKGAQGALLTPDMLEDTRGGARAEGGTTTPPSADADTSPYTGEARAVEDARPYGADSSVGADGSIGVDASDVADVSIDEGAVLDDAIRSAAQGKRVVEVDTSTGGVEDVAPYIDTLEAALGTDELLRRMYTAAQMHRPTGMVEVDGQRVDAGAYMDAYERSLPDDVAALEATVRELSERRTAEIVRMEQEGTLEDYRFGGLKIDLQLFAAQRKWDLLQLDAGEDGKKARQFYEKRLRGTDANHNQELVDLLAGRSETYNPIANEVTLNRAKDRLRDGKYQEKLIRRIGKYNPRDVFSAIDVAAAQVLINDAINDGEPEVAADLIAGLSRKGTELGRAVQAFSMMARLTPEGTLRAALRTVKADADYVVGEGADEGLDVLADDLVRAIRKAEEEGLSSDEIAQRIRVPVEDGYSTETEQQRYERLKDCRIKAVADRSGELPDIPFSDLEHKAKSKAQKTLRDIGRKLGIFGRDMTTPDIGVSFQYHVEKGLLTSIHHQQEYGGNYADFAKMLVNIDELLENAVLVETHTDKYDGTYREDPDLDKVYVLFSLFQDGELLYPVQFEVKTYKTKPNKLYLTAVMTKREAGVVEGATSDDSHSKPPLIPASEYSIADAFGKINPTDKEFLKYIPDGFLSDEQKNAKQEAQEKERRRIEARRKKGYSREELTQLLSEDLATERGNFFTQEEIYDLLWKTVDEATNIPQQLRRYVLKQIRKDDGALAQRIYELHLRGDLKQSKLRWAMEEALELPHLTTDDIEWVVKQGGKIQSLQDKPVEQADAMDELYDYLGAKLSVNGWDRLQAWRKPPPYERALSLHKNSRPYHWYGLLFGCWGIRRGRISPCRRRRPSGIPRWCA